MSKEFLQSQNRIQDIEAHSEELVSGRGSQRTVVVVGPGDQVWMWRELIGFRWEKDQRKVVR